MKSAYKMNADLSDTENKERIELGEIYAEYAKKFRADGMPEWRSESPKHKKMSTGQLKELQKEMQKVNEEDVSSSWVVLQTHLAS